MNNIEFSPIGQESVESTSETLWNNDDVVTFSLRRHSHYVTDPDSRLRGGLTMERASEVRGMADEWKGNLPQDSEVSIFASPSGLPAKWKVENPDTEEEKVLQTVMVQRANITSSIYEQEIFGEQQPRFNTTHEPLPDRRRNVDERLGDILEHARDGAKIDQFFKSVAINYKGLTPQFWTDWLNGNLNPEVAQKFSDAGGVAPIDAAIELSQFLVDEQSQLSQKSKKEVALVVTHGEKLEAFQHYINQFLATQGRSESEDLSDERVDYNQGYNIHMQGDNLIVDQANRGLVEINKNELLNFLISTKEAAND